MSAPAVAARPARALLPAAGAAAAAVALHAACGGRYGLFRDELYFLRCGLAPALGYVDQPPLIAWVARLAHAAVGLSVPGLRLLPWLAAGLGVLLAGKLALALGADRRGALLAAVACLAAPAQLALGHLLTMNAFEAPLWTGLALGVVGWVEGRRPGALMAAAACAGIGLLNKFSMGYWSAALALGLLLSPQRGRLLDRRVAGAAALALGLALPGLAWQAVHGLPFLELVRNGQLHKNAPLGVLGFLGELCLEQGPPAVPLWLGGLGWLLAAPRARPHRHLGIAAALLLAFLLAAHGKPYYASPLFPLLFAAGGAAATPLLGRRAAVVGATAALAIGLVVAPIAVPLLPEARLVAYQAALGLQPAPLERQRQGLLPQVLADQHGWPELAAAVARAAAQLTPGERARAVVYAANYGEAAAVDLLGRGLPPAVSGHNQYWLWGVPPGRGDVALVIGGPEEGCGGLFRSQALAARVSPSPWVMPYEDARAVWICRGPARPLAEIWAGRRHYE